MVTELTPAFENCGCAIVHADSARKALQLFVSDSEISLVILEAVGTAEASLDFFRQFKNDRRRAMVPVVVAGHGFQAETVRAFVELHIDDVLALPMDNEAMRHRLCALCNETRFAILIVDDENAIRELLAEVFQMERFHVYTASSAVEAISILAKSRVDAVVSDICMPGKSGYDLLVHVKEVYSSLPFIMITGFSGKHSPKDVIAAGADGYFTKPFHNSELIATLHRILSTARKAGRKITEPANPA